MSLMAKLPSPNATQTELHNDAIPALYKLSHMYTGVLGFSICMVVGVLASLVTLSAADKPVPHTLTYPLLYKLAFFLPHNVRLWLKFGVVYPTNEAKQKVKYRKAALVIVAEECGVVE